MSGIEPRYDHAGVTLYTGSALDVLRALPDGCARTCVTSPPYWQQRSYTDAAEELGHEATLAAYIDALVAVFREVRRCLTRDGTLWIVVGDGYAGAGYANHRGTGGTRRERGGKAKHTRSDGLANKQLMLIPARLALALQADGWWIRNMAVWAKSNAMPDSTRDRLSCAHETIILASRSRRYFFDWRAIREPAVSDHPSGNGFARPVQATRGGRGATEHWQPAAWRTCRDVWTVPVRAGYGGHPGTFPPALIERCILVGSAVGDTVLDPFSGTATTAYVARHLDRRAIGIELGAEWTQAAIRRLAEPLLEWGAEQERQTMRAEQGAFEQGAFEER